MNLKQLFIDRKYCPICCSNIGFCRSTNHYFSGHYFKITINSYGEVYATRYNNLIVYYKESKIYCEAVDKDFKDFDEIKKYMESIYYKVVNNLLFI